MSEDPFYAYLRSLDQASSGELSPLPEVADGVADLARRCAIPHHFDAETLAVVCPDDTDAQLKDRVELLLGLPYVSADADGLFIHDTIRATLFSSWLGAEQLGEFKEISTRLFGVYEARISRQGLEPQLEISAIFHLFAFDQTLALQRFGRLFTSERERQHLGFCQKMLEWASEYGDYLASAVRGNLQLFTGLMLSDLRDWNAAIVAFTNASEAATSGDEIHTRALLGLAQAYSAVLQHARADDACKAAYSFARNDSETTASEVLLVWGRILRDAGELDRGESLLRESADRAVQLDHRVVAAAAFNALGTLHRRRNDPREAIDAFRKALTYLNDRKDLRLIAGIKVNLGALLSDLNEWPAAEESLLSALKTYTELEDKHGEATTLNNMLRTSLHGGHRERAVLDAETAANLFVESRDYYAAATTRVNLSNILRKAGRFNEAESCLSEAVRLFERAKADGEAGFHRKRLQQS